MPKFVVAPQVDTRRRGDIWGTEVEEIQIPMKEKCEFLVGIIGVKRKPEETSVAMVLIGGSVRTSVMLKSAQ